MSDSEPVPALHKAWNLRGRYLNAHLFEAPVKRVDNLARVESAVLIVVLSGRYEAKWTSGGMPRTLKAHPGDVVCWTPNARRLDWNSEDARLRALCVYFDWPGAQADLPVVVRDRGGLLRFLAHALLDAKDAPRAPRFRAMLSQAYLAAMLAEYIRLADHMAPDLEQQLARHTERHLRHPIRLADLARAAGLTPRYFARRYRELTGRTPQADVRRIRIEHAIGILRSSIRMPLKDIATRVGLRTGQHLCRLLKQQTGMTARLLRLRLRRGAAGLKTGGWRERTTRKGII
jgi:AraC-like DNA-binding protein